MTVIIKMKMILLYLDNHKNVSKIFLNNFFVFDKYKNNIAIFADFGQVKKDCCFADFRHVNFLLTKLP